MTLAEKPVVSVIIPTYNSAQTLELCLEAVRRQTFQPVEIIVIDKHSNDATQDIAHRFGAEVIECGGLIHEARNAGLAAARSEYFVALDSDIELSPTVIEECVGLGGAGADIITFPEAIVGEGFWAKCRALEAQCYLGDDTIEAPRFFRTDIVRAVSGYQTADAEDWDLRERLLASGYRIHHIESMTYHHEGHVSLVRRVRKKFIYTGNVHHYVRRHRKTALRQFPLFRSAYYRNWKLLARDPVHAAGFMVMKTLETMAVLFGMVYHQTFEQHSRSLG